MSGSIVFSGPSVGCPLSLRASVAAEQLLDLPGGVELLRLHLRLDRWGRSLHNQINGSQVAVLPWRSSMRSSGTSYRVAVSVSRFDGSDHDALVAAMPRALVRFGHGMGDSIAEAKQVACAR